MLEEIKFIVYGITGLNKRRFKKIRNRKFFNKPRGGLWASPMGSILSWKDWCLSENFRVSELKTFCMFKLKPGSRIYVINTFNDLLEIPFYYDMDILEGHAKRFIDFERMKKEGYQGIFLTANGERSTMYSPPLVSDGRDKIVDVDLFGWDVESLLIFDYNCLVPITETRRIKLGKKREWKKSCFMVRTDKSIDPIRGNFFWSRIEDDTEKGDSGTISVTLGKHFKSRKSYIRYIRSQIKSTYDDPRVIFKLR